MSINNMDEVTEFKLGDKVKKKGKSSWRGTIVGTYSHEITPMGFAVLSTFEPGSVQIYPASALEPWDGGSDKELLEDMFRVMAASQREYNQGWNDAIQHAIDKFGGNSWVHEREYYLGIAVAAQALIKQIEGQDFGLNLTKFFDSVGDLETALAKE